MAVPIVRKLAPATAAIEGTVQLPETLQDLDRFCVAFRVPREEVEELCLSRIDEEGHYRLEDVPTGPGTLQVQTYREGDWVPVSSVPLEVSDGQTLQHDFTTE